MQPVARFLWSRQFALAVFCVLAAVALLCGLFARGVLGAEKAALLVLALYIGSKVFMLAAAAWVAARQSARFRHLLIRAAGKLRFPLRSLDPRSSRRTA